MKKDNGKRRVCVVLVDRANYGRLQPVMKAIQKNAALELQVVAAGTMLLERFDSPVHVVEQDGFEVNCRVHTELEGSTPATMAKSVGFGVIEFGSAFSDLEPDLVLIIGDRYEALSATVAAAYMNLTIVHIQGGEVSGSIDESARHAITKLSHFHFPSTARAREYLVRMGERPETILGVGCPSSDLAKALDQSLPSEVLNSQGAGAWIDPAKPFHLVVFHPTTTEYGAEWDQMAELLEALERVRCPSLLLWPNIDAGSDHISKTIRLFRTSRDCSTWLRTQTNLTPDNYLKVLANATCAIGNSSSFVRDAGYFGTPVVLVGNRQRHREHDAHVLPTAPVAEDIEQAIRSQHAHGRYAPSELYGDGAVANRIAEALERLDPYVQKHLSFVEQP